MQKVLTITFWRVWFFYTTKYEKKYRKNWFSVRFQCQSSNFAGSTQQIHHKIWRLLTQKQASFQQQQREEEEKSTTKIQMIQKLNPHNSLRMDGSVCVCFD